MAASPPVATVKYSELLDAFEFVSLGPQFEHSAYIESETGAIFWVTPDHEFEEEVPNDIETSDRYLAIPHKNELNLGRALALAFADQELPGQYDTVVGFFRKKGAYRRFKNLGLPHDLSKIVRQAKNREISSAFTNVRLRMSFATTRIRANFPCRILFHNSH